MKHLYKTKQFLFRIFLAGIFLILYAVTASAVPVSAQSGISDDQRKASASLITWDAYQGLDEAELSSRVWQFCGRAEHGTLPGETYYDGALYVETLGDRSDYFVLAGDSLAWTGYSQGRSLNSALALWTAPDPMARDFSSINPYVYCAANPIRYIDPSGCEIYFNAKGVKIYETPNNDLPFMVLTTKKDEKNARNFIEEGRVIPLPTEEQIGLMEEAFEIQENEGIEAGFDTFENGYTTPLVRGTEETITFYGDNVSAEDTEGSARGYNVHTHKKEPAESSVRQDLPSPIDLADIQKHDYKYPNIVLGYDALLQPSEKGLNVKKTYSHSKRIVFYDKKTDKPKNAFLNMSFDSFKDAVNKIRKSLQNR